MTYSLEIRHPASAGVWVDSYVFDALQLDPVIPAPAARPARSRAPGVTCLDLQWLRERLMFAFMAPCNYREDLPEQARTGAYDTTRTRDAFPKARALELAECPLDGAEKVGRLPIDYVASLARDTSRVTCSETRPKKSSSNPLPPSAFSDARLVRIVGGLADEHRHWLRYTYADSKEWADEAGTVSALWVAVAPAFGKLQGKTLQKIKGLAHLAVQHAKREANNGQELYQAARLAELLGVKTANYDQHWRPRWQALLDGLRKLDEAALRAVLAQYDRRKG